MRPRALRLGLFASALVVSSSAASAEPPHVHASAGVAHAVGGMQERELGYGAVGDLAIELPLASSFGIQGKVGGAVFSDGKAPLDPRITDRGASGAGLVMSGLRVHDPKLGLWADVNGGLAVMSSVRFAFDTHLGWDFALDRESKLRAGPVLGYLHVLQPDQALRPDDAHVFSFGGHMVFDTSAPACEDRDKDGICDGEDVCPGTPGRRTGDQSTNGCPRFDRDRDGVFDDEDACVSVPGRRTDDPKTNGCPRPDRDQDTVYDDEDACVDVPGIRTSDPKTNGCPRSDRDGDLVFDEEDACPDVPGPRTADRKTNGCPPAAGQVRVEGDRIVLDDVILFDVDSPRVRRRSYPLVAQLAKFLTATPDILEIDIEGHADRRGSDDYNQHLSELRAARVQALLVKYGVDAKRVQVRGFGESRPKTSESALDDRTLQVDRRVELWIVKARVIPQPTLVSTHTGASR